MQPLDQHRIRMAKMMPDLPSPRPAFVELYTSDVCSLRCRHCFHGDTRSSAEALSAGEWLNLSLACAQTGAKTLQVSGREPFASKSTVDLLSRLRPLRTWQSVRVGAISDGFSWRKYETEIAGNLLDYLEISLEGPAAVHELIRGPGTFARTADGIVAAAKLLPQASLSLATTLLNTNIPFIRETLVCGLSLGVTRQYFQPMQPVGWADRLSEDALTPERYGAAIEDAADFLASADEGRRVIFYVPFHMTDQVAARTPWLWSMCQDQLRGKLPIMRVGNNILNVDFDVWPVPYRSRLIFTNDGYLIPHFSSRSSSEYVNRAVGNIRTTPLPALIEAGHEVSLKHARTFLEEAGENAIMKLQSNTWSSLMKSNDSRPSEYIADSASWEIAETPSGGGGTSGSAGRFALLDATVIGVNVDGASGEGVADRPVTQGADAPGIADA